jgi:N-acetylneuraminate synthase
MDTSSGCGPAVEIAGRRIGAGEKPYLIAEMSANHNGSLETALAMVDAAADAGADALKLQTYTPDTITYRGAGPEFTIQDGLWKGWSLYDLYARAMTPWEWHAQLFERGRALGLDVFSAPFDETAVDFLETLDAPVYKIASFELTHLPLIRKAASTGKPLIMSTGMASWAEIDEAVATARSAGCRELVLLHCVSGYPTPASEANLPTIPALTARYNVPVGLSDHTLATAVATAAVALGACVVEKHFILDRSVDAPDAAFSLEPMELRRLCHDLRDAGAAVGTPKMGQARSEAAMAGLRRSIYVVRDIAAGEAFTPDNVRVIRPGYGLAPRNWDIVLACRAATELTRGTPLDWTHCTETPGASSA